MNIYDIAARAGVSVATVSRVINNSQNVSEQSRKRIMDIINKEGYVPNVFARNLNLPSSKTIGVLCPIISDVNHAAPVSILVRILREAGYDILLHCPDSVGESKENYLNLLYSRRVDAIIVIGSTVEECTNHDAFVSVSADIPIIIINGFVDLENVYCILSDERKAVCQLVQMLHSKANCKNILYLNDTSSYSGYQKILGYKDGYALCKLEENPALMLQIPEQDNELEPSYHIVYDFIENGMPFDAVIAADDILAVGAQKALQAHHITVPIIGFNNSRFAQCSTPEISSVETNMETICTTAAQILMDVLHGGKPACHVLVSTRFIARESFCPQ